MLKQADDCVFSLCMDKRQEVFSSVVDTYNRLKSMARELGVVVEKTAEFNEPKRLNKRDLKFSEKNLFISSPEKYEGRNTNIKFCVANSIYQEVEYVVSTLVNFVREKNYRYRDFTIVTTNEDRYYSYLTSSLKNYDVPFYSDIKLSIKDSPIIRFTSQLINLASKGYDINSAISLLKCGFSPFTNVQIAEFEDYCFVWGVKGNELKSEFSANPNGFAEKLTKEDQQKLELFNKIRLYILDAIALVKEGNTKTAKSICQSIFDGLIKLEINKKVQDIIDGDTVDGIVAQQYSRVWDILLEILDSIAQSAGDRVFNLSRFREIFDKACSEYDMGTIPQSLDSVTIGAPERIRMNGVKIVFLLGAQKNEFPKMPSSKGVFSEAEQTKLEEQGIVLSRSFELRAAEQRYNAYKITTMASDAFYMTASTSDIKGTEVSISELFYEAEIIFGKNAIYDISKTKAEYYCKNDKTAFLALSRAFYKDTKENASIIKYLESTTSYKDKLALMQNAGNQSQAEIKDNKIRNELFPSQMFFSPTSFENFYKCKFKFFCGNGLKIYPRQKADLNPMSKGTIIHYVLEMLLKDSDFKQVDEDELRKRIGRLLDDYLVKSMSGDSYKTPQFIYLYNRLKNTLFEIASYMQVELTSSEFQPSDLEYQIGGEESDVDGFTVETQNGDKATVFGRIDRIDIAEIDGEKYVRVIDYKSGGKDFSLSDVVYGQNMQMLLYLFCIWKNGKGKYENSLPAGILYMPSKALENSLARGKDDSYVETSKMSQFKMKGLLVDNLTALNAMEKDMNGLFIPVKLTKTGKYDARVSSIATMAQMGKLYKHTEYLLQQMTTDLRMGDIKALPLQNENDTICKYCNYNSVCGLEDNDTIVKMRKHENDEVYAHIDLELGGEQNGD